jgi:hypothetical protein
MPQVMAVFAVTESQDPGDCWVSPNCFLPNSLLSSFLFPAINSSTSLRVFYNTVVKSVTMSPENSSFIESLTAITRFPTAQTNCSGWDRFLSEVRRSVILSLSLSRILSVLQDLPDWYNKSDSQRFEKQIITFTSSQT